MRLNKFRKEINKIDAKILKLLARRFLIANKIKDIKKKEKLPIRDQKREEEIFLEINILSKQLNLNPVFTKEMFKKIIKESRRLQNEK
ncbi:chorismate mutase [Patescibacteria group bacterium]|nr:chorismate mutase [Patescibacteria group bacterium]MCL5797617.1 chorismate mutase [Patescibacteria group bacterium]